MPVLTQARDFETKVLSEISEESDLFRPLSIQIKRARKSNVYDADVQIEWQGRRVRFEAEILNRTAPQLIESKIQRLAKVWKTDLSMLIVPYLSDAVVKVLEEYKMSGLDLNGNYYIAAPDLLAIRRDRKNAYKESSTIRKIYSGNSSIVCRYLLATKDTNKGIGEITDEIRKLGSDITISTVSKVLKRLEEELIISKAGAAIKILQRDKLLEKLREEYAEPKISEQIRIKSPEGPTWFLKNFAYSTPSNVRWVLTGASSASKYTVATTPQAFEIYTDLAEIPEKWFDWEDNRFFNVVLKRTSNDVLYFDRSENDGIQFSSRIQTYIELARGDKRERETAEPLKEEILGL